MKLLLLTLYLLTDLCDGELIQVTGALGGSVSISCHDTEEYHRTKMFCKFKGDICTPISSTTGSTSNGRFAYEQRRGWLRLNISRLTEDDTAVYWCGVISEVTNWITRVKAFVLHVTPVIGYEGGDVTVRCPYEKGYESLSKQFLRENLHGGHDLMIESSRNRKGRFSFSDDTTRKLFTVTITGLNTEDSGKYYCAIEHSNINHEQLVLVKKLIPVTGHEGQPIHITCSYLSKDSEKYFCRGELAPDCVTNGVKVAKDQKGQDRFSLREEATSKIFTVTITDLRAEDAGIYWCGEFEDKYLFTSAVHLEVRRDVLKTTALLPSPTSTHMKSGTSTHMESGHSGPAVILSVSLTIAVLLFGIALFICHKYRKKKRQGLASTPDISRARQARQADCVYEEVNDASPDDSVYANTQRAAIPPDDPAYSAVSFHKKRGASAAIAFSEEEDTCEYSSVKCPTK